MKTEFLSTLRRIGYSRGEKRMVASGFIKVAAPIAIDRKNHSQASNDDVEIFNGFILLYIDIKA